MSDSAGWNRIAQLEAENERLRKALENIHVNVKGLANGTVPTIGPDARWYFQNIEAVCRSALGAISQ